MFESRIRVFGTVTQIDSYSFSSINRRDSIKYVDKKAQMYLMLLIFNLDLSSFLMIFVKYSFSHYSCNLTFNP